MEQSSKVPTPPHPKLIVSLRIQGQICKVYLNHKNYQMSLSHLSSKDLRRCVKSKQFKWFGFTYKSPTMKTYTRQNSGRVVPRTCKSPCGFNIFEVAWTPANFSVCCECAPFTTKLARKQRSKKSLGKSNRFPWVWLSDFVVFCHSAGGFQFFRVCFCCGLMHDEKGQSCCTKCARTKKTQLHISNLPPCWDFENKSVQKKRALGDHWAKFNPKLFGSCTRTFLGVWFARITKYSILQGFTTTSKGIFFCIDRMHCRLSFGGKSGIDRMHCRLSFGWKSEHDCHENALGMCNVVEPFHSSRWKENSACSTCAAAPYLDTITTDPFRRAERAYTEYDCENSSSFVSTIRAPLLLFH